MLKFGSDVEMLQETRLRIHQTFLPALQMKVVQNKNAFLIQILVKLGRQNPFQLTRPHRPVWLLVINSLLLY
jgi:hypothetical protein